MTAHDPDGPAIDRSAIGPAIDPAIGPVIARGPARGAGSRRRAWLLVAAGVVGVSLSGPLAASAVAPALAVAFWRSAFGAAATAPVVAARQWTPLRAAARSPAAIAAGVLLAVHFGTWIPSLRLTSVTASTALVTAQPLWIVLIERLRGRRVPPRVLVGTALGVAGALLITGLDAGRSPQALAGDLLALVGGVAGAGYVLVGEHARRSTATGPYTLIAYTWCALALLPTCLLLRVPLAGWGARGWAQLLLLTAVAQLLGHTAFNAAVPVVGAAPLSLAILLEVPGATLVAWVWLQRPPPPGAVPGVVALLAGLVVVVRRGVGSAPPPDDARSPR